MNERLFDACGRLDPAEVAKDKGAFFGSILATLNHIAVADAIWLHRFAAHRARFPSLQDLARLPRPSSLRDTLAADLGELRTYRQSLDDLITRWTAELKPEHLLTSLEYTNMAGVENSKLLGELLLHFFNHQTHHRGQVTTLLFQSGVDVGVTDLLTLVPSSDA
jgi:uncharacterized damage-inducible protein DinB